MFDHYDAAAYETEQLLESTRRLRAAIVKAEAVYRRTLKELRRHSNITASIMRDDAAQRRQDLTDALLNFEHQRHAARLSLIAAQLAEGESIGGVGRSWGFSRQLASKYAHEVANGDA
jgi:hypothetical protein